MHESSPDRAAVCRSKFLWSSTFQQRFGRCRLITEFHKVPYFGPDDRPAVQPQSEPAAVSDVRGWIETLRLAGSAIDVLSQRRLAAHAQVRMIVEIAAHAFR